NLVSLVEDCLAFRARRFRQDIRLKLLDEFSRLCRGLIEMKAADQLWFVTLDRGQGEETARRPKLEKILHRLVTAFLLGQMCQRFLQPGLDRRFAPNLIKIALVPARPCLSEIWQLDQ